MNEYYFYHLTNNHHEEVKLAREKQSQPSVFRTASAIGSLAVVLGVLYWLATLGV